MFGREKSNHGSRIGNRSWKASLVLSPKAEWRLLRDGFM
jgi:hypothetical protein